MLKILKKYFHDSMLSIKKYFHDSTLSIMRHFLIDEYNHLNKEIIERPYNADEAIKKRDAIKLALFGVNNE